MDRWTDEQIDRFTYQMDRHIRRIDIFRWIDRWTDREMEKNDRLNNKQFGDQYKHKINKR